MLRKLREGAFRNERSDKVIMVVGQFHWWWCDDSLCCQVTHYIDDMIIVIISYVITDTELQRKCCWFIGFSLHFVDKAKMLPLSSSGIVSMSTISILPWGHFDADFVIPDGTGDDHLNTLRPRQNGLHFPDDIFKWIFLNVWISINISQNFVPRGPLNNNPALVQIMAWRQPGDKPLSEAMMVRSTTHICVTRPQWVNDNLWCSQLWPIEHRDNIQI